MVKLGQNFLVDRNILDVIERLAELSPDDVVLEIGGGPGILSERLAARASFVHVVELDRRSRRGFARMLGANAQLHIGDALELDLTTLHPVPTKIVANLPYGIAATVILRTIERARGRCSVARDGPARGRGAARRGAGHVRLRRAVGARAARVRRQGAAAGLADGVPARAERRLGARRPPSPRARSGARRCGTLVNDAFAHRRKALAGSLALAPGVAGRHPRPRGKGARGDGAAARRRAPSGSPRATSSA